MPATGPGVGKKYDGVKLGYICGGTKTGKVGDLPSYDESYRIHPVASPFKLDITLMGIPPILVGENEQ